MRYLIFIGFSLLQAYLVLSQVIETYEFNRKNFPDLTAETVPRHLRHLVPQIREHLGLNTPPPPLPDAAEFPDYRLPEVNPANFAVSSEDDAGEPCSVCYRDIYYCADFKAPPHGISVRWHHCVAPYLQAWNRKLKKDRYAYEWYYRAHEVSAARREYWAIHECMRERWAESSLCKNCRSLGPVEYDQFQQRALICNEVYFPYRTAKPTVPGLVRGALLGITPAPIGKK